MVPYWEMGVNGCEMDMLHRMNEGYKVWEH